jgi:hypothetical protein
MLRIMLRVVTGETLSDEVRLCCDFRIDLSLVGHVLISVVKSIFNSVESLGLGHGAVINKQRGESV